MCRLLSCLNCRTKKNNFIFLVINKTLINQAASAWKFSTITTISRHFKRFTKWWTEVELSKSAENKLKFDTQKYYTIT